MSDETYTQELEKPVKADPMPAEDRKTVEESFGGARHLDCAPGHVQEAIARIKRGEHLNVPK